MTSKFQSKLSYMHMGINGLLLPGGKVELKLLENGLKMRIALYKQADISHKVCEEQLERLPEE